MTANELAARYRGYAADCIKVAAGLTDPANKLMLLNMAAAWIALAEQAERNGILTLLCETSEPPASQIPLSSDRSQV
jgi:hypothetical protein